jgi:hypothetical protein
MSRPKFSQVKVIRPDGSVTYQSAYNVAEQAHVIAGGKRNRGGPTNEAEARRMTKPVVQPQRAPKPPRKEAASAAVLRARWNMD